MVVNHTTNDDLRVPMEKSYNSFENKGVISCFSTLSYYLFSCLSPKFDRPDFTTRGGIDVVEPF